jgi:hypothetical protein
MNRLKLAKFLYSAGIFIVLFFVFMEVFFFLPYIHETGHILFGFGNSLLSGNATHFTISAWMSHPLLRFIPLPQQTKIVSGTGSANFALGGPFFMILIFLGISLFAYLKSRNPLWFLIFFSIVLFEISGDIICGTDNLINSPLAICNHGLDLLLQFVSIAVFSSTLSYFTSKKIVSWKPLKIRRR